MQIKDVREEVRDAIVARAVAAGKSTQAYLRDLLEREFRAERNRRLFDTLASRRSPTLDADEVVEMIRAQREGRDG